LTAGNTRNYNFVVASAARGTRVVLFLSIGLAVLIPAQKSSARPQLKIAILAPVSGPTFGASMRDGALLAIDQWNSRGGVLGAEIFPVVEDSHCAPDEAVNAANKVIGFDKVHYIIGEVCSQASIPISEIANAARVIQISPVSTHPGVTVDTTGATKPYVFRACFIDSFQGKAGAEFAYRKLGARRAFLTLDQGDDYSVGLSQSFAASFRALGGTIVAEEKHTFVDTDFSAILAKVKAMKPDVVYLPDYYGIVNLVMRQAKEKGITVPFLGGDAWDSYDLDVAAAAGGYYTDHYDASDPRPEVKTFLQAWGVRHQMSLGSPLTPDSSAAMAYDATNLLLTAITIAGADDTGRVKAALEHITFKGVSGAIRFDAQHNPVKGAVIIHVTNGRKIFDSFISP
jgi:branched-chain amino acid transport system substrate-binding protein